MSGLSGASIAAVDRLPGVLTACSHRQGWRTVLLRRYDEPLQAEFETLPTDDQLIVLVRRGGCHIESRSGRDWRRACYVAGDIGATPPGEARRLRFHGPQSHQTLQLHIPGAMLNGAPELARGHSLALDALQARSDVIATVMRAMEAALKAGAPDIYAESAVHFLLAQLSLDRDRLQTGRPQDGATRQRRRIEDFMRANIGRQITLAEIAGLIDVSVFQLIRLSRAAWGMTPAARLGQLRMDHGRCLLEQSAMSVMEIALECGYENPSHFATAFRRRMGCSPTEYRTACGGAATDEPVLGRRDAASLRT